MEITDNTYHTDALADPRIVRSGTTEVRVISGSYGSEMYGVFGPHLNTALNGAAETITKAKVAVGEHFVNDDDTPLSSPTNFTFNNSHLTELMLDDINNTNVKIVVGTGCTSLTTLEMQNATVKSVSAAGVTSLTKASLDYTTTAGDIDLSGCTSLTTLDIDNTDLGATSTGGVLNISGCTALTSLNLSTLKAKSVNASNTNALTTLNINGITLNDVDGSYKWSNTDDYDELRSLTSGTVELTRTPSGNYSNLQVYYNSDFITDRLIPTADAGYTGNTVPDTKVEITLAGNTLSEKMEEHGGDVYAGSVQILHVTGELTTADITYIKEKMPNLDLLDLSECTNAVTATNLIGNIPTTTAIVLPGVSATNGAIAQTESSRASDKTNKRQTNDLFIFILLFQTKIVSAFGARLFKKFCLLRPYML